MISGGLPENLPAAARLTTVTRLHAEAPKDALEALMALPVNGQGRRLGDAETCFYGVGPGGVETFRLERVEVDLSTPLDENYGLVADEGDPDQTTGSALGALLETVAEESAVAGIWVEFAGAAGSSATADWQTTLAFGENRVACDQARTRHLAHTEHPDFSRLAYFAAQGDADRGPVASFADLTGGDEPVYLSASLEPADGATGEECRILVGPGVYEQIQAHFGAVMGDLITEGWVPYSKEGFRVIGHDLSNTEGGDIAWLVRPTGVAMRFYWQDRGETYQTNEMDWHAFHAAIREAAPVAGPTV